MDEPIRAPRCPGCDAEPVIMLDRQYFCSSGDCQVFCWDPTEDPAKFKATAHVIKLDDGVRYYDQGEGTGDQ